jgi:hypothetical protein
LSVADGPILLLARERVDQILDLGIAAVAMLARAVARHAEPGVVSPAPVQQQLDPSLRQGDDDLLENGAQVRLRVSVLAPGWYHAASRSAPSASSRSRSAAERDGMSADGGEPLLLALDLCEPVVPAPLEFAGDETVRRVHCIVLPARQVRLVPRLLQRELPCRRMSANSASRVATATRAASTPSGSRSRRTSAETAAPTRMPPKAMQVCVP